MGSGEGQVWAGQDHCQTAEAGNHLPVQGQKGEGEFVLLSIASNGFLSFFLFIEILYIRLEALCTACVHW